MPIGLGFAPLGVSLFGFGSVDTAPVPLTGILVDANDGLVKEARKIDQFTRRYVLDSSGRVQGMRGVYQLVQLRVQTLRNSSALRDFGLAAPSGVIGANIQKRIENDIALAMKDLVDQKIIKIVSVQLDRFSTSGEYVTFKWIDLTAQNVGTSTVSNEQVTKL